MNNCIRKAFFKIVPFSIFTFLSLSLSSQVCISKSNAPWNEWIAQVQLNTLNNVTSKTRNDRFVIGYSDWRDKSTTLAQGQTYPLSITPGLSWSGYQTALYFRAWIDFDANGVYDVSELVLEKSSTSLAVNQSLTVPPTATIGTKTMRISMKKDAYSTACETFAAGEVEDYTVVIQANSQTTCANNALNFDGNNDYLQTVQYAIPANTNFTMEASFTSTATATGCSGNFKRLLALELSNSAHRLEIGDCAGQLTLFYFLSNGGSRLVNIPNATNLRNGNWHHVAASKSGDTLRLYYDGALVLTESGLQNINDVPRILHVGRWALQGENWQGNVDEVRVWQYAVSATDIENRRLCTLAGNETGLILHFPFNQGISSGANPTITTVIDKSPTGITTPLSNFALSGSISNWVCSTQNLGQNCTPISPCTNDVTPPVLSNIPSDVTINCANQLPAISTLVTATDNCTPQIRVNFVQNYFRDSLYKRTWTATDNAGNTVSATQEIRILTVNDSLPPVFNNCPANINLTARGTTTVAAWTQPTVTDNCATPSVSSNYASGQAFPLGTTTVIYTATDRLNNTATCRFSVIIGTVSNPCDTDRQKPIFTFCPANIVLTTTGTTAVATWAQPFATDNCGITRLNAHAYTSGSTFPIGSTLVAYSAYDAKNNFADCIFSVTVTRQIDSVRNLCANPSAYITGDNNSITISGITTSAAIIQVFNSNWSPVAALRVNTPSYTFPNIGAGTYNVKVNVLGVGGTWPAVCIVQSSVIVGTGANPCTNDVTAPVFSNCPTNINLTTATSTAVATWTPPTATDNCTTPSVSSDYNSGFAFPVGTTAVIYTARDVNNNTRTCTFNVVVTAIVAVTTNDISLAISSPSTSYRQWTPIMVLVSASNNGTVPMSNIRIELKRPLKTSSGGVKTPSVGVFNDYCSGGIECSEWVIPSLAVGATANLSAPFFVLDATAPIAVTTQLLFSTPTNGLSNNLITLTIPPQTPLVAPNFSQLTYQKPTQLIPIVVQKIAPNPTEGELIVKLESLDAREVTFDFFNAFGKLVKSERKAVEKGENRVGFDVFDLEQGVHFVIPSTTTGHKVPTKFVKM
ncbi:MAG: HYR domain-containing protein [Saprospiraceae bacterium]|nr:HYR domain-containing protein [Saprospiraceae bacterium]